MIFYPYGVGARGRAEGQLESMAAGNTLMVPLIEEKAQVLSRVILHNGNCKRPRDPPTGQRRASPRMMASMSHSKVDRENITRTYQLIRPHIRRTPIVEVEGSDFGLHGVRLIHKLELLQHSGSFKARGAFTNLLMRQIPAAGVVAASGGNHGAAVAFAAMRLKKPARIFVPEVASPAKLERIRSYGAELVVTGQRYADALAASEEWAAQSGALVVHTTRSRPCSARAPSAWNWKNNIPVSTLCWWPWVEAA